MRVQRKTSRSLEVEVKQSPPFVYSPVRGCTWLPGTEHSSHSFSSSSSCPATIIISIIIFRLTGSSYTCVSGICETASVSAIG